jgi:hypothetical protein
VPIPCRATACRRRCTAAVVQRQAATTGSALTGRRATDPARRRCPAQTPLAARLVAVRAAARHSPGEAHRVAAAPRTEARSRPRCRQSARPGSPPPLRSRSRARRSCRCPARRRRRSLRRGRPVLRAATDRARRTRVAARAATVAPRADAERSDAPPRIFARLRDFRIGRTPGRQGTMGSNPRLPPISLGWSAMPVTAAVATSGRSMSATSRATASSELVNAAQPCVSGSTVTSRRRTLTSRRRLRTRRASQVAPSSV